MKGVRVDPAARTVRVEGGCTWGDVDHATHAFGLATPSGIISTTGVGGLTLGGGIGHLTRKYGLTIDNLLAADVVLADGSFVTASAEQNADLFWALRGGGGNFGVVTSFLFRLHPGRARSTPGPMFWPMEQTRRGDALVPRVHRRRRREDLNGFFAFLTVPPVPPFPEALHSKKVCGVVWCYTGPLERGRRDLRADARSSGRRCSTACGRCRSRRCRACSTRSIRRAMQWYWRADFVNELSDEAIAVHVRARLQTLPTLQSTMHLYPIDGAAHRVEQDDTAFSYRDANWAEVIVGVDPDPANDEHDHAVGQGLLGRAASVLGRRRLRELHDGRRAGARPGDLPRQLRRGWRRSSASTTRTTCSA